MTLKTIIHNTMGVVLHLLPYIQMSITDAWVPGMLFSYAFSTPLTVTNPPTYMHGSDIEI